METSQMSRSAADRPHVPICVLIDAEPDGFFIDPAATDPMHGLAHSFEVVNEVRDRLQEKLGRPAHFVWLVRADKQIADTYGDAGYLFHKYAQQFGAALEAGDDVGIHFHAYRLQPDGRTWVEDYGDQEWVELCLRQAHEACQSALGSAPLTASAGHSWLSNETVRLEETLGLRHELSVVAGRASKPFPEHMGIYTGGLPDFSDVPAEPYHPSLTDYRVADPARTSGLWIIPHVSGVVAAPTLRAKLRRAAQKLGIGDSHRAAPNKVFLRQGPQQITPVFERALMRARPYLTITSRTAPFARQNDRDAIRQTFTYLMNHPQASRFHFSTPAELLEIHGDVPVEKQPAPAQ